MQLLSLLSFFTLLIGSYSLIDVGVITWNNLGREMKTHVATYVGGVNVSGNAISELQQYAPRAYIMNEAGTTFYRLPNLLGHGIRFTVDVSSTTCSCNAALFLCDFPSGVDDNYYCDAQGNTPDTRCVEIDLIEANTRGYQGTLHCGDGSQDCKFGCGANYRSDKGYGPGGASIDTRSSYQVYISFAGSTQIERITYRLTQSGKSGIVFTIDRTSCTFFDRQVASLTSSITSGRLVVAISYWSSSDMNWLDGCSTGQTCPKPSYITFSNIQISNTIDEENQENMVWSDI